MGGSSRPTPRHREADKTSILEVLNARGTVSAACAQIGIDRSTFYEWVKDDDVFAVAVDAARERITDILERTAVEMALEGYTESREVLDQDGNPVELSQHRRDPQMLRFLIGARRRQVYGDKKQIEHSGEVTTKRIVFGESKDE